MSEMSNDGINFTGGMTTKEAIDNLQGVAGFVMMLFATGAIDRNLDPKLLKMFDSFPSAVNKAIVAMITMDNQLKIESEDDGKKE